MLLLLSCNSSVTSPHNEWVDIQLAGAFVLQVPPGTKTLPNTGGGDSLSGRITGPDFTLQYDYGFYSNPLDGRASEPGFRTRTIEIGGRQARLIVYNLAGDAKRFIGVHFPEFKRTPAGPVRLTLTGTLDCNEKMRAQIEKIFRSIRILEARPQSDESTPRDDSQAPHG